MHNEQLSTGDEQKTGDPSLHPMSEGMTLRIDLHGMSRQKAQQYIESRFAHRSRLYEIQKLFVITGRGNHVNASGTRAVLWRWLPEWLKTCSFADRVVRVIPGVGTYEVLLSSLRPVVQSTDATQDALDVLLAFTDPQRIKTLRPQTAEERVLLGMCYVRGIHVTRNVSRGLDLLNKAARDHHPLAIAALGDLYHLGIAGELKPNYKKGAAFLQQAYELGSPGLNTIHNLARCYFLGQGVRQNDTRAFELLHEAAEAGSLASQLTLGIEYLEGGRYDSGFEVKQDFDKAYHWLTLAAERGDGIACHKLGVMHYHGYGVEQSEFEAVQWYKRGAQDDEMFCIYHVGLAHLGDMEGMPYDPVKGAACLQYVEDCTRDVDANMRLAICEIMGEGVPDNLDHATSRLDQVTEQGGHAMLHAWRVVAAFLKRDMDGVEEALQAGEAARCPASAVLRGQVSQLYAADWLTLDWPAQLVLSDTWLGDLDVKRVRRSWFPDGFLAVCDVLHRWDAVLQEGCHISEPLLLGLSVTSYRVGLGRSHRSVLWLEMCWVMLHINEGRWDKAHQRLQSRVQAYILETHDPAWHARVQKLKQFLTTYQVALAYLERGAHHQVPKYVHQILNFYRSSEPEHRILVPAIECLLEQMIEIMDAKHDADPMAFHADASLDPASMLSVVLPDAEAYRELERLDRILGRYRDVDGNKRRLVQLDPQSATVSFPVFWLRQLSQDAMRELSATVRVPPEAWCRSDP